jgi:hypothetical protein
MKIPDDMRLPLMRRDTTDNSNVRWLLRNLAINNFGHPDLGRVISELHKMDPDALVFFPGADIDTEGGTA